LTSELENNEPDSTEENKMAESSPQLTPVSLGAEEQASVNGPVLTLKSLNSTEKSISPDDQTIDDSQQQTQADD